LQPGRRSRRPRRTRLLRQDACLTAPAPTSTHSTESPGRFPQPGPLREQLAPQSIPFASIVRCLVALVARRRATASSAGTVGHRASFNHGTSAEPAKDAPPLSPRARSDLGDCRGPLPHPHDSERLGPDLPYRRRKGRAAAAWFGRCGTAACRRNPGALGRLPWRSPRVLLYRGWRVIGRRDRRRLRRLRAVRRWRPGPPCGPGGWCRRRSRARTEAPLGLVPRRRGRPCPRRT
jgi:hypothetical protein